MGFMRLLAQLSKCQIVGRSTIQHDMTSALTMRIPAVWIASLGNDEYDVDEASGKKYLHWNAVLS